MHRGGSVASPLNEDVDHLLTLEGAWRALSGALHILHNPVEVSKYLQSRYSDMQSPQMRPIMSRSIQITFCERGHGLIFLGN